MKEWMSCRDAAMVLGVSPRTVQEWAREGKVVAKKIGHSWLVHRSVVEAA
jgi:excisionase family DNA binding protein